KQTHLHGVWKFQCITCNKLFSSSQAIDGHTRIHFKEGRVKGTHNFFFVSFPNSQQLESSTTIDSSSTHHHQQIFYINTTDIDSPNSHKLILSPLAIPPKQDLRLRDMNTLARLRGPLTKEEEKVVLLLLDMAKK
ncbi:hypothetical protein EJD97_009142, partial [Solanum chilense]